MPSAISPDSSEFCITDVGSTTTKAILFQRNPGTTGAADWSCVRREVPTTVEKPHADVMVGVVESFRALEEATGKELLSGSGETCGAASPSPAVPYLSTSSAGGGLAMVVTGLVREITSRSAERVALGAGAILLDVIAMDDRRTPYEKIQALKQLRPDMVLLAGGFDGEAITGPVFLAELIREAGLRPKLSATAPLPVIYAGNANATDFVRDTLGAGFLFHAVPNVRPSDNRERLEPARDAIQDLFMTTVMSQAPGYDRLLTWVGAPVLPTPGAVGKILALASRRLDGKILAVDIGGATTDVFTAQNGRVLRTVSANLGMSYSIVNVVRTAGIEAIEEVLHADFGRAGMSGGEGGSPSREALWDLIGNKHLRPTRLPSTADEVMMERAVAAIAIREAVRDHMRVLEGFTLSRGKDDLSIRDRFLGVSGWGRKEIAEGPFRLSGYDLVIGSGGILSHSERGVAAAILAQGLRPRGTIEVALDGEFMSPHLGVLSEVAPELAVDLFLKVGLVRMGKLHVGAEAEKVEVSIPSPRPEIAVGPRIRRGEIRLRRELAIPGEVFVGVGDEIIAPDTLIARSTRQFQRPFFFDVAGALEIPPSEVPRYLLRNVGDDVRAGDLIAERKMNVFSEKTYRAPLGGRIERILPSGVLVVRERTEEARELAAVNVARDLLMTPDAIRPYVRVQVGQSVDRGQHIAARTGRSPFRFSASPVRGTVVKIDYDRGIILIEPLLEKLEITAWVPGRVEEVTDRGCVVINDGIEIQGIWGMGGEAHGVLTFDEPGPGRILFKDVARRDDLTAIAEQGCAGLICGSLHIESVIDRARAFTIVVMEGFGAQARPMSPEVLSVLRERKGDLVLIDGTTELRIGVRRPRIVLPRAV